MNYDDVDWEQERPGLEQLVSAWTNVELTLVDPVPAGLLAVEAALADTHGNGWAKARQFTLGQNTVLHWFLSRNRLDEADFFRQFFSKREVLAQFDRLGSINDKVSQFAMRPPFSALGDLASAVAQGGAYKHFGGSDAAVFKLIADFSHDGLGSRASESTAWYNWTAWAEGFFDVAWDGTFIFFDRLTARITAVAFTDTD